METLKDSTSSIPTVKTRPAGKAYWQRVYRIASKLPIMQRVRIAVKILICVG